jgi:sugar lactone lactonase
MSTAPTTRIFSDVCCTLGEGPMVHAPSGQLFWFDILGCKLLEQSVSGGPTRVHELPNMASAAATLDADRLAIVTEDGLYERVLSTGAMRRLLPIEADNAVTRSNDSRVHPSGAMWVGTMGKNCETGAGAIYWLCRGTLKLLFANISIPNSICFTADGTLARFADSGKRCIWQVVTDPATGLPQGEPQLFYQFGDEPGDPDGSVMDRDGVMWNARWGAGQLDAYSPDGKRVRSIALPAIQPTCPVFAGAQADRLAVTSAAAGLESATAEDGLTFVVDVPVNGFWDAPLAWD